MHQQASEAAAEALRLRPRVEDQEPIASMFLNVARGSLDGDREALQRGTHGSR